MFPATPLLGPSCLNGPPENLTPLLRADVSPPRRTKTHGSAFYRFWREFFARNVKQFKGEIEQDFCRQTGVSHHGAKPGATSDAERAREI
ncbi:MAG TPA: hypothetical protein VJM31_04185 [Vicinamibacterales bacterium]|nr:hypothetical protein [Vicinamibacterales bacterium]